VTDFEYPQMQELIALAARLGRDRLVVQGPGGNISLKQDSVMWVKASGTWMMEAESRSILIPIDFAAVLNGLAAGDPACETCSSFVRHDLTHSALRPSIETTLHAVMPQKVVVHAHCVETISIACLSDAADRLAASLKGLNWTFVPYVRPGASLGRAMVEHMCNGTNIVVGNMASWSPVTPSTRRRSCAPRFRGGWLAWPAPRRVSIGRRCARLWATVIPRRKGRKASENWPWRCKWI
jgi:rhamnose utilization protein RhaD (predicted bifunctional aldolase and dehydrogenase)